MKRPTTLVKEDFARIKKLKKDYPRIHTLDKIVKLIRLSYPKVNTSKIEIIEILKQKPLYIQEIVQAVKKSNRQVRRDIDYLEKERIIKIDPPKHKSKRGSPRLVSLSEKRDYLYNVLKEVKNNKQNFPRYSKLDHKEYKMGFDPREIQNYYVYAIKNEYIELKYNLTQKGKKYLKKNPASRKVH